MWSWFFIYEIHNLNRELISPIFKRNLLIKLVLFHKKLELCFFGKFSKLFLNIFFILIYDSFDSNLKKILLFNFGMFYFEELKK